MLTNKETTWKILNDNVFNIKGKLESLTILLKLCTSLNYIYECRDIIRNGTTYYTCSIKKIYQRTIDAQGKKLIFRIYFDGKRISFSSFMPELKLKDSTINNESEMLDVLSKVEKIISEGI